MSNTLSVYYSPHHWYPQDEEYIRRLDPAWIRIHQPTARAIYTAQKNAPNAKIMLRSWDIDDHNGDRKREMYADPKGAAANHLRLWNAKWHELETELDRNGWAYDESKWFVGLVNEPDPAYVPQVVEYSLEAMAIGKAYGWRLGVVASSVGTFSKPSENGDGWAKFKPLEKPINEGGHILIAHEYWQPEGPNYGEDAGNLAWRHRSIPLNVPILIGESGANGYIYGRYSKNDDSGWQVTVKDEHGNADPHKFAAQVKEYIEGCDQRVQGVCLYMLDYHDKQWASFNTGPANEQLLAIKDARPQRPSPFGAPTQAVTMYVIARDGANLRQTPDVRPGNIITAVAYGEMVTVTGRKTAGNGTRWAQVQYQGASGWMAADLLGTSKPTPAPAPVEPTEPAKVPTLVHPVADPRWRKVTQAFAARPQYYSQFKIDGVPLKGHEGIDFGTPPDSWIVAVDAGRVVEVEDQGAKGYGRYIKIVHAWGESVYAHLSGFVVRLGDTVQAGDIIAKSGYTGNVDPVGPAGAHLHFGLRVNPFNRQDGWGGYVDPAPYLINVGGPTQPQPPSQHEMVKMIALAALEFEVDSDLLLSQAWAESSFNPRAVSNVGAKGLMQIMPNTWAEQSALIGAGNDPFDPQQNARVGARYMKYLLGALGNKPFDALVAYGWGIGNVLGDAPYPDEWVGYANKIIHGRDLLKAVGA